MTNSLH